MDVAYASADGTLVRATWEAAGENTVVMAHGITGNRDEGGMFADLTAALAERGMSSLRFDFRAHGESEGEFEALTIAGEIEDLSTSIAWLRQRASGAVSIVAASFGAVSACEYAARSGGIERLVLWNPVLDLRRTFLEPECDWPKQSFNPAGFEHLERHGFLWLDGQRKVGRALIEEMRRCRPYERLAELTIPVLTLHGGADTCVPYDVSREHGAPNAHSLFVTLPGADHGFARPAERTLALHETLAWLTLTE